MNGIALRSESNYSVGTVIPANGRFSFGISGEVNRKTKMSHHGLTCSQSTVSSNCGKVVQVSKGMRCSGEDSGMALLVLYKLWRTQSVLFQVSEGKMLDKLGF